MQVVGRTFGKICVILQGHLHGVEESFGACENGDIPMNSQI